MFAIQPFRRQDVQSRIDSIFDQMMTDMFDGFDPFRGQKGQSTGYPKIDIQELPEKFVIDATVPGLTKADIKIEVVADGEQRYLTIKSEKVKSTEVKRESFLRKEIHRSSFCRNLALPDAVDEGKILAEVKDGILTIELPKKNPEVKLPKTIPIEIK